MIPYNITPKGINFIVRNIPRTIPNDHKNFADIKTEVIAGNVERVLELCDIVSFIAKITNGMVKISDDQVRFGDKIVNEYLAKRILDLNKANEPIDSICRFTEKLMENPNLEILSDLYEWLEAGNMPIYDDGDFVAFKVVKKDFTPIHTGPYGKNQAPGTVVEMPRELCDSNRHNTCSTGLHFCSYDYLPHFSGFSDENVVIVLKINPKDVTAIPSDYNNTKGRCCRFEVIGTVPATEVKEYFGNKYVVTSYGNYNPEPEVTEKAFVENEMTFSSGGKTFTISEIVDKVDSLGVTQAANALGVPRSTLGGWKKRIDAVCIAIAKGNNFVEKTEPEVVAVLEKDEMTFEHHGSVFAASSIMEEIDVRGLVSAARYFSVPRSTLGGWKKRIEDSGFKKEPSWGEESDVPDDDSSWDDSWD